MATRNGVVLVLAAMLFLGATPSYRGAAQPGYVVVFNSGPTKTQDDVEIARDLDYAYGNLVPWLKRKHIGHRFEKNSTFSVILPSGKKLRFDRGSLKTSVGMAIIRPNGQYKVMEGVDTDIDLQIDIQTYLELH